MSEPTRGNAKRDRRGRSSAAEFLLTVAALLGAGALGLYAFAPEVLERDRPVAEPVAPRSIVRPAVVEKPEPAEAATEDRATAEPWFRVGGSLRPGQTMFAALSAGGVDPAAAQEAIRSLEGLVSFRRARPGDRYEVAIDETGAVKRFQYQTSSLKRFVAEEQGGKLVGRRIEIPVEKRVVGIGGRLRSSLYETLQRQGEDPGLAFLLVDAFAWDIDFYCDPREGDTFRMLVEQLVVEGRPLGYSQLLAAEYLGELVSVTGYRHEDQGGGVGYYDERGQNLQKTFLKSPLKYARVTSGFGRRVHPVLGFSHRHNGVDFAAPSGTPVWAAADGMVKRAGWIGACGRAIFLRHPTGHETQYCHLSRIAPGVKLGQRVAQKQVIGAVGSTGRSTGPHLHYGMKNRGRFVNPLTQNFPRGKPLPGEELEAFSADVVRYRARLAEISIGGSQSLASQAQ